MVLLRGVQRSMASKTLIAGALLLGLGGCQYFATGKMVVKEFNDQTASALWEAQCLMTVGGMTRTRTIDEIADILRHCGNVQLTPEKVQLIQDALEP